MYENTHYQNTPFVLLISNFADPAEESGVKNLYFQCAAKIQQRVMDSLRQEEGCDPKPYFFPALPDKLLRDRKELPMCSCLQRDQSFTKKESELTSL